MLKKLTSMNRYVMYLLLVVMTVVPLFIKGVVVPTVTSQNTEDFFLALNDLPENSTVFLESDWTVSTQGENAGQMVAILKALRMRNVKFVIYSCSDAQAPLVALNVIRKLNKEFKAAGVPEFKEWEDYVTAGFYPDIDALYLAIANNPRSPFKGKVGSDTAGKQREILESPVLKGIKKPADIAMVINISASGTLKSIVQRVYGKIKIAPAVTGVMGPEAMNYYASKQVVGLSVGLRGAVEMETMMARGINYVEKPGNPPFVKAPQSPKILEPYSKKYEKLPAYGRGMQYFASLHAALTLLIFAVILGNVGLIASRKKGGNN
jgi:hypothetical protein